MIIFNCIIKKRADARLASTILIILFFSLSGCTQRYYNVATQEEETYFYSSEKEVKIGQSVSKTVEKRYKPEPDAIIQQRIKEIGDKIAQVSDRCEIRYYFSVLAEDEKNAFALPGGYIYIFKGLWDKIKDKDDLIASVLAHEIAHICARHNIKRLQKSIGYGTLSILVAGGMNDGYSRSKALVGINELLLSYSRKDELQADRLAVKYLSKAGYNTESFLEVLNILQEEGRKRPTGQRYARTHPYITERVRAVREILNGGNIKFDDYINTK